MKVLDKEKIYHEEILQNCSNKYLEEAIEKIKKLNLNKNDLIKEIKEVVK